MRVKDGFKDESIAYALAANMVSFDDRDGEKSMRRRRFERRKAHKKERG